MQHPSEIWSNLKGQIYLGDEAFVTEIQKRIGKEKDDLAIPKQQTRPMAKPLSEIAAQYKDRNTAIIAAYKTGVYSQREIGAFYQLHPTTTGVLLFTKTRIIDSGPFLRYASVPKLRLFVPLFHLDERFGLTVRQDVVFPLPRRIEMRCISGVFDFRPCFELCADWVSLPHGR